MQKSSQVSPMRLGPCDAAIYQISVVQILLGSVYKVFEVDDGAPCLVVVQVYPQKIAKA